MRTLLAIPLLSSLFGGCVIYDETIIDDTASMSGDGRDSSGVRPDGSTDDEDANASIAVHLSLDPAGAVPGDATILSLKSDGQVDLSPVTSVRFLGSAAISVLTSSVRDANEYLLAIDVPEDTPLGAYDVLVEFQTGTAVVLTGAFSVVGDASQIPASPADDATEGSGSTGSSGSTGDSTNPCGG
jgi:hypothetical protein